MNLPELPVRALTLDVPLRDAYFVSFGAAYVIAPNFNIPLGLFEASGVDLELDAQLLQHSGRQDHMEGSFALVLRTGDASFWGAVLMNFAVGEGLSLAFSKPTYEKGPDGVRGIGSRRFQNHLMFELEFTLPAFPFAHAVARLHHRSGVYGLISPQKTGSNYLGLGIRVDG